MCNSCATFQYGYKSISNVIFLWNMFYNTPPHLYSWVVESEHFQSTLNRINRLLPERTDSGLSMRKWTAVAATTARRPAAWYGGLNSSSQVIVETCAVSAGWFYGRRFRCADAAPGWADVLIYRQLLLLPPATPDLRAVPTFCRIYYERDTCK